MRYSLLIRTPMLLILLFVPPLNTRCTFRIHMWICAQVVVGIGCREGNSSSFQVFMCILHILWMCGRVFCIRRLSIIFNYDLLSVNGLWHLLGQNLVNSAGCHHTRGLLVILYAYDMWEPCRGWKRRRIESIWYIRTHTGYIRKSDQRWQSRFWVSARTRSLVPQYDIYMYIPFAYHHLHHLYTPLDLFEDARLTKYGGTE